MLTNEVIGEDGQTIMRKYNDCEQLVYQYLRNYSRFQSQVKSLDMEADGIREQIKELGGLKAVCYDTTPVSGGGATSPVERAAEQADRLENKLRLLSVNRKRIVTLLQRLDVAMETLDGVDRQILELRHIRGCRWVQVALEVPYSEHGCQIHARKAVRQIAAIMFPAQSAEAKDADFFFIGEETKARIQ